MSSNASISAKTYVPTLLNTVDKVLSSMWTAIFCFIESIMLMFLITSCKVLPVETVLRIWDCLFSEGSKVLFRVCLAILKLNEANFLAKKDFTGLMEEFKRYLSCPEVTR